MTYRTYFAALSLLAGGLGCTVDKGTTDSTSEGSTASTGDQTTGDTGDTGATTADTTSSTTSAPSEGLGSLSIESPDEGEILYSSTETIHVVLHGLTAGELIEIQVWSEEGSIDEPTCDAHDCMFVLDLAGVAWGRQFLITARASVMTDDGVVSIDAPPVEVEHISP
jgi:hypothetical protein